MRVHGFPLVPGAPPRAVDSFLRYVEEAMPDAGEGAARPSPAAVSI
jgi:hypothetical protein